MRGFLLLMLLVSPVVSTDWDHFQFDITFFCNFEDRSQYHLKIQWYEADSASAADELTKSIIIRPSVGRYSFTMEGAMNGDEILSAGYHPIAYMSHDCTSDRKRVDFVLDITTLCVLGQSCHYRIIKDITNTWGSEKAEATKFKAGNLDPYPDFP